MIKEGSHNILKPSSTQIKNSYQSVLINEMNFLSVLNPGVVGTGVLRYEKRLLYGTLTRVGAFLSFLLTPLSLTLTPPLFI